MAGRIRAAAKKVKAHIARNKKKYIAGAVIAAGLGGAAATKRGRAAYGAAGKWAGGKAKAGYDRAKATKAGKWTAGKVESAKGKLASAKTWAQGKKKAAGESVRHQIRTKVPAGVTRRVTKAKNILTGKSRKKVAPSAGRRTPASWA